MTARLAVGIGCRSGVTAEAVVALVEDALARVPGEPLALFTIADKHTEAGLWDASVRLGLPLVHLPTSALEAVSHAAVTHSERVVALKGVPSVAECAALAGAGPGATLLLPRIVAAGVTCAIAAGEGS